VTRRFLTAEDVRSAQGRTIQVDAATVVTPQAQEEAERLGVALVSGAGAWKEPTPDRGPDAQRAARALPHLPEPDAQDGTPTGVVVTAVGRNRPGVLAEVTAALQKHQADVQNVSQRVTGEYFHMILLVAVSPNGSFASLKDELQCLGGEDDYVVRVMHERVFRFMHRV
jgi:ACT domain-containing protein